MSSAQGFYDAYWNKESATYSLESFLRYARRRCFDQALAYLQEEKAQKILFIGPGDGREVQEFINLPSVNPRDILLLDFSFRACASSKLQFKNLKSNDIVTVLQSNALCLPFDDNSIDSIFISMVLMHLDHKKLLSEAHRVLKPQGSLIIAEPLSSHPLAIFYRMFFSDYKKTNPSYLSLPQILHSELTWTKTVHKEFYHLLPYVLPVYYLPLPGSIKRAVVKGVDVVDSVLENILLPIKNLCWMTAVKYSK